MSNNHYIILKVKIYQKHNKCNNYMVRHFFAFWLILNLGMSCAQVVWAEKGSSGSELSSGTESAVPGGETISSQTDAKSNLDKLYHEYQQLRKSDDKGSAVATILMRGVKALFAFVGVFVVTLLASYCKKKSSNMIGDHVFSKEFCWEILNFFGLFRCGGFCHGDFARHVVLLPASLKRPKSKGKKALYRWETADDDARLEVADIYVKLQSKKYNECRNNLWGSGKQVKSGIFVMVGASFTGRKTFLERELSEKDTQVLEVDERKWLNVNDFKVADMLKKRLDRLCARIFFFHPPHSVVLLLAPSLRNPQNTNSVVEQLCEIFGNDFPQCLTLILKTNSPTSDAPDAAGGMVQIINIERLEPKETYDMLNDDAWKRLPCHLGEASYPDRVKRSLRESPFYQVGTNGETEEARLTRALFLNSFGQPRVVRNLISQQCYNDEHWRNVLARWRATYDSYCTGNGKDKNSNNVQFYRFVAFLWFQAAIHGMQFGQEQNRVKELIARGQQLKNVNNEIWLDFGLANDLETLLFSGRRFEDLERQAFVMYFLGPEEALGERKGISEEIDRHFPDFVAILHGVNWEDAKNTLAQNLYQSCILVFRLDQRDERLNFIAQQILRDNESRFQAYLNQEIRPACTQLAETYHQLINENVLDWDVPAHMAQNIFKITPLELSTEIDLYLRNAKSEEKFLEGVMKVLPLIIVAVDTSSKNTLERASDASKLDWFEFCLYKKDALLRVFYKAAKSLDARQKCLKYIAVNILPAVFGNSKEELQSFFEIEVCDSDEEIQNGGELGVDGAVVSFVQACKKYFLSSYRPNEKENDSDAQDQITCLVSQMTEAANQLQAIEEGNTNELKLSLIVKGIYNSVLINVIKNFGIMENPDSSDDVSVATFQEEVRELSAMHKWLHEFPQNPRQKINSTPELTPTTAGIYLDEILDLLKENMDEEQSILPGMRFQLIRKAINYIAQFSWEESSLQLLYIYQEVLDFLQGLSMENDFQDIRKFLPSGAVKTMVSGLFKKRVSAMGDCYLENKNYVLKNYIICREVINLGYVVVIGKQYLSEEQQFFREIINQCYIWLSLVKYLGGFAGLSEESFPRFYQLLRELEDTTWKMKLADSLVDLIWNEVSYLFSIPPEERQTRNDNASSQMVKEDFEQLRNFCGNQFQDMAVSKGNLVWKCKTVEFSDFIQAMRLFYDTWNELSFQTRAWSGDTYESCARLLLGVHGALSEQNIDFQQVMRYFLDKELNHRANILYNVSTKNIYSAIHEKLEDSWIRREFEERFSS